MTFHSYMILNNTFLINKDIFTFLVNNHNIISTSKKRVIQQYQIHSPLSNFLNNFQNVKSRLNALHLLLHFFSRHQSGTVAISLCSFMLNLGIVQARCPAEYYMIPAAASCCVVFLSQPF